MGEPIREGSPVRQCLCVLTSGTDPVMLNTCGASHANPDQPLCGPCTEARHEDQPHIPYTEVIAARQEGRAYR